MLTRESITNYTSLLNLYLGGNWEYTPVGEIFVDTSTQYREYSLQEIKYFLEHEVDQFVH